MGQRAGSKWSVVFSDVSMLAVPLLAFQIVASSWSVCTNSLHLDFSTPFNRLFSFAVDVACSCVFVKFWILYIYSKFLFMIFLKPVFAHAPCSHRLCPILVSILSLLETICVAFFCDLFLFLYILFALGLCVYAIFSFAIFAIPWAIVRLHPHWKREINASCYSFRSRLNFSLSLNLLFASFFCHRVTIFSVSARMLSFLKMHSKFFVDICVAFAHHLSFMCTISFAYRVFRSNSKRKRNKNINSQRAKSFVSFFIFFLPLSHCLVLSLFLMFAPFA